MEIKKIIKAFVLSIVIIALLTACGKKYSDYPNSWVSEDGKVIIEPEGVAQIQYEGIDFTKNINVLSDSGKQHLIFCYGDKISGDDSERIWEAEVEIEDNKLYLKIINDKVTGLEGKTIVLEQSKK